MNPMPPPVPDITSQFSSLDLTSTSPVPTVPECIAHLKLLEIFHQLREEISTTDGLFGITDHSVVASPGIRSKKEEEEGRAKNREKRWAVYVTRAVDRFQIWWEECVPKSQPRLTQKDVASEHIFEQKSAEGRHLNLNPPPLDVLMCWHSYMLNPRSFFEDCLRHGKLDFWVTGMPWKVIDSCIDNDTFEYRVSYNTRQVFENSTGRAWDNLYDTQEKTLPCSNCGLILSCPWTRPLKQSTPGPADSGHLENDTGYAAKHFREQCPRCSCVMTHDLLRVQKFRNDVRSLQVDDVPMPGTILSLDGLAIQDQKYGVLFPNRLISAGLKFPQSPLFEQDIGLIQEVDHIRRLIEISLKNIKLMVKVRGSYLSSRAMEKIACRRMLSHYWDNSSLFALDLVGAVIRQGSFIKKMHTIDWLHSPALSSTMKRLIIKYGRYLQIIRAHPGKVAVPTLDVDLAWHTHQISPRKYYEQSIVITGTFVDHDDKIEETKLSDAFGWTGEAYQKMFGEVYSECTCWYCEAIRYRSTPFFSKLFKGPASLDGLYPADPSKTAHISAHSAVRTQSSLAGVAASVYAAKLESAYQRIRRRAIKEGREPPARDGLPQRRLDSGDGPDGPDDDDSDDSPYLDHADITTEFYAGTPACMNIDPGAVGNCAAGTCGARVAAGACGGMSGSCAGGPAGGCGSGGSSGGGGSSSCGGGSSGGV